MGSVLFGVVLFILVSGCSLLVIPANSENDQIQTFNEYFNDTNGTAHDLYVIKTIVYEVGILTDADNDTDNSNETHEQIDLTFYDPKHNSSAIDLSNIPFPLQTNVSEKVMIGIAPKNVGIISLPSLKFTGNGTSLENFPFNVSVVPNIVLSHTSNISTTDPEEEKTIIEGLPEELGV